MIFPRKKVTFTSDDHPWINSRRKKTKLKNKTKNCSKHSKNIAWERQNNLVCKLNKDAMHTFYKKQIDNCKNARISQWSSKFKKGSLGMFKICQQAFMLKKYMDYHMKNKQMLSQIKFKKIKYSYEPLKKENIEISHFEKDPIPFLHEHQVEFHIKSKSQSHPHLLKISLQ